MKNSVLKILAALITSGLIAGILDGISAVVFLGKLNFSGVWKFVAAGYFGQEAFKGGNIMVLYGLLFHFSIAMFWSIFYYFLIRRITFFNQNIVIGGLAYGIIIWIVMNLVVLPNTAITQSQMSILRVIMNISILMLCVGVPIAYIQHKILESKVQA